MKRCCGGLRLLMALLVGALSGCRPEVGRYTQIDADANFVPEAKTLAGVKAASSDTLMWSYSEEPDTLNAVTSGDVTTGMFQAWVYDYLASRDIKDPDKFEPQLAESWEFDQEKLEYTIHLRRGVYWHPMQLPNGTPLPDTQFTARDVKFTFDCILNQHIPASRGDFEDADAKDASERYKISLEVVDDYTVKIRWRKPYFLSDIATLLVSIIPRHVYSVDAEGDLISLDFSSKEFADGFNSHWANNSMCGTGPMIFRESRRKDRLVLERNPRYWGPPFYFSRVIFSFETNDNTTLQKVLQEELDWSDISQKDLYLQAQHHPSVTSGKVKLKMYKYPQFNFIHYNLRNPFLSEKLARKALTHAVPINTIIKEVYRGFAEPITGPFQPDSIAYDSSVQPLAFDLKRARSLLDRAGWRDTDHNGIRDKKVNGKQVEARIKLMMPNDSGQYLQVAQIIQNTARKIGVRIDIEPIEYSLMLERLRAKEFDAVMRGYTLSWNPDPYDLWHGSQADLPGSGNSGSYKNKKVDALIDKLRVTFDRKKQIGLYHQIHRILYDDQPCTFLFTEIQTAGYDSRLQNVDFYKIAPCINVREWTASEPR